MDRIDVAELSRKNLNLLVVFDIVAETRSVTIAAGRLSLTQSALSHAIGRLRTLFNDPLFFRGGVGLILSPRAEALVLPVRDVLVRVEGLLLQAHFDPASTDRIFRIALSEYFQLLLGKELVREVTRLAPNARLEIEPFDKDNVKRLAEGEFDITMQRSSVVPQPLLSTQLFRDRFIGVIHAGHPLASKARECSIDLDDYLAFPHIQTSLHPIHEDEINEALEVGGHKRRVTVSTRTFALGLLLLVNTQLIATIPSRIPLSARGNCSDLLPFEIPLTVVHPLYRMIWHRRTDADPALSWLRMVIERVVAQVVGEAAMIADSFQARMAMVAM